MFSFAGIGAVLPMKRSMTEPNRYLVILDVGFVIISALLIGFGTIGYCGYGDNVNSGGITLNLPQDSFWTIITQLCLIVGIYATYPVVMYPVIEILDEIFFNSSNSYFFHFNATKKFWASNFIRAVLVILTSIIAISVPYFSLFVSLVGALGSSFIAFIVPCVLHLKLFSNKCSKKQKYINWFLIIFGVIASFISATITIIQLIEAIFDVEIIPGE